MMSDWGITQGARLKELRLKKGFTVPYVAKRLIAVKHPYIGGN